MPSGQRSVRLLVALRPSQAPESGQDPDWKRPLTDPPFWTASPQSFSEVQCCVEQPVADEHNACGWIFAITSDVLRQGIARVQKTHTNVTKVSEEQDVKYKDHEGAGRSNRVSATGLEDFQIILETCYKNSFLWENSMDPQKWVRQGLSFSRLAKKKKIVDGGDRQCGWCLSAATKPSKT